MKILLTILCAFVLGASSTALLGREKCTYGPSYWCNSIQNAKSCGAVKHCIKAVWEKQHVPVDTDSICKICLDMVTQARDQLESNETMDEIRQVFEGSCDLIPIKVVKKECKVLADDFIPELVESLASQMNPQVVCSTAGLCNSARIDKLLEDYNAAQKNKNLLSCDQCNSIGNVISHKFHTSSRDQVLDGFLAACGQMSSFTDACSSLVLSYFSEIYLELSKNLNSENICHMSGVCSAKFHQHEDLPVEIETKSNVGFLKNKEATDDMPCDLCKQLVHHLRDILVANTTEAEFKSVLEGLCGQTKSFKDECVGLVDEYYDIIYQTLTSNLDPDGACFMIGVCPKGNNNPLIAPSAPLLPSGQKLPKTKLGIDEHAIKLMPLPIDRLMGAKGGLDLVDGGELCPVCQMFLHYIQEELSDARNEDEVKEAVGRVCDKFPMKFRGGCHNFINMYGDALIAMLVQEIDPRDLCPTLKFCPQNARDVEVDPELIDIGGGQPKGSNCPICVMVVKQAENYIKNDKTEQKAKAALKNACTHFSKKLQVECQDFVDSYYDELLKKLISELEPKKICSELNFCPKQLLSGIFRVGIEKLDKTPREQNGDIVTNLIPDSTFAGRPLESYDTGSSGACTLCEKVVAASEDKVIAGMKRVQIEDILYKECAAFKDFEPLCDNFVKENTDKIMKLFSEELSPKQICQQLTLCARQLQDLDIDEAIVVNVFAVPSYQQVVNIPENPPAHVKDDTVCVLCEFIMNKLEKELKDKTTRDQIRQAVENICTVMPKSINGKCVAFIEQYADLIIDLVETLPPKEVCQNLGVCAAVKKTAHLVGESECTWGPSHFCSNHKIAAQCKATDYCKRKRLGMFA